MKTIVVTCAKGQVRIETSGFAGQSCLKATEGLKKALGFEGEVVEEKPEFYEQDIVEQEHEQH